MTPTERLADRIANEPAKCIGNLSFVSLAVAPDERDLIVERLRAIPVRALPSEEVVAQTIAAHVDEVEGVNCDEGARAVLALLSPQSDRAVTGVSEEADLVRRLWQRVETAERDSRFGDAEDMRSAALALSPQDGTVPGVPTEKEIEALIREHVGVGYDLSDGGTFDPSRVSIHAAGAAVMIVHRFQRASGEPTLPMVPEGGQ